MAQLTYRDAVADAKSAIRFLRAHGAQYGLDTSRVAVWGESAGGYVASMTGVTNAVGQWFWTRALFLAPAAAFFLVPQPKQDLPGQRAGFRQGPPRFLQIPRTRRHRS